MRRRRSRLEVSTFPFLAVLLGAMGSLILVLLIMDRRSKLAARARVEQAAGLLAQQAEQEDARRRAAWEEKQRRAHADWEQARVALHERLAREKDDLLGQARQIEQQLQEAVARLAA